MRAGQCGLVGSGEMWPKIGVPGNEIVRGYFLENGAEPD